MSSSLVWQFWHKFFTSKLKDNFLAGFGLFLIHNQGFHKNSEIVLKKTIILRF